MDFDLLGLPMFAFGLWTGTCVVLGLCIFKISRGKTHLTLKDFVAIPTTHLAGSMMSSFVCTYCYYQMAQNPPIGEKTVFYIVVVCGIATLVIGSILGILLMIKLGPFEIVDDEE